MNASSHTQTGSDPFAKFFAGSIIFHILVVLFFSLQHFFPSAPPIDFRSAVKVDLVALPDKMAPDVDPMQEPTPPAPPVAEPVPQVEPPKPQVIPTKNELKKKVLDKEAINLEKTKTQQRAAIEKMKELSAFEKIQKDVNKRKAAPKIIKGNTLSSGTELKGFAKLQFDDYLGLIDHHIRKFWTLPQYLRSKSLVATIQIRIDANGQVISSELTKSSGNANYDEVAMSAVQKSSPLPRPPSQFVRISSTQGLEFNFRE